MIWDMAVALAAGGVPAVGITLGVCTILARRYGRWWEQ